MKLGLHLATSLMVCGLLTHSAIAAHSDHNGRSQTASGTAVPKTKEAAGGDAIDLSITVDQGDWQKRQAAHHEWPQSGFAKIDQTHQNVQIHRQASSTGSAAGPQRNLLGRSSVEINQFRTAIVRCATRHRRRRLLLPRHHPAQRRIRSMQGPATQTRRSQMRAKVRAAITHPAPLLPRLPTAQVSTEPDLSGRGLEPGPSAVRLRSLRAY